MNILYPNVSATFLYTNRNRTGQEIYDFIERYQLHDYKYKAAIVDELAQDIIYTRNLEYPNNIVRYILENMDNVDYIFIDIWHDVSDGIYSYLKFKKAEKR